MKRIDILDIFSLIIAAIIVIALAAFIKIFLKKEDAKPLHTYEITYSGLFGRNGERRTYTDTLHVPQVESVSIATVKQDNEDVSNVGETYLLLQYVEAYNAPIHYVNVMTLATYFVPVEYGVDSLVSFRQISGP